MMNGKRRDTVKTAENREAVLFILAPGQQNALFNLLQGQWISLIPRAVKNGSRLPSRAASLFFSAAPVVAGISSYRKLLKKQKDRNILCLDRFVAGKFRTREFRPADSGRKTPGHCRSTVLPKPVL
jgi:hypothetical protein